MLRYNNRLKPKARDLRKNMTDSENVLWSRLRRKQLLGVQFYRQKPIGNYVVDFFAPRARLVVEVDGLQHMEDHLIKTDQRRDAYLANLGLHALRFGNRQVLQDTDRVVEMIYRTLSARLDCGNPPYPPLIKEGTENRP
jgi:very-short-patch-repair endonuclease